MVFRRWMIVVAACLLLLVVLAAYKVLQIRKLMAFAASFPEVSETVEAVTVQAIPWTETLNAVGTVVAPQHVELRNQIEGRVAAVGFEAGAKVKKDQMLVQLDASEEISQLRAAQAEAVLAQLALERYQKLMSQQLSSRDQYDQARAQYDVANAKAQELQARIDKKTLTAPFDSQTGLHQLQAGQYLDANTLITQMVGVQDVAWVDFAVPQQQAHIELGAAVSISARGLLDNAVQGTVMASEPMLSTSSRLLRLRAVVDNAGGKLKAGAMVNVMIMAAPTKQVLALPITALHHDTEGAYVFVINPVAEKNELRASKRRVVSSAEENQQVAIETGLQAGEQVASNGSYKLQDKMLTYIKAEIPVSGSANNGTASGIAPSAQ